MAFRPALFMLSKCLQERQFVKGNWKHVLKSRCTLDQAQGKQKLCHIHHVVCNILIALINFTTDPSSHCLLLNFTWLEGNENSWRGADVIFNILLYFHVAFSGNFCHFKTIVSSSSQVPAYITSRYIHTCENFGLCSQIFCHQNVAHCL